MGISIGFGKSVPVLRLHGVIGANGELNIEGLERPIERAFDAAGKGGRLLASITG